MPKRSEPISTAAPGAVPISLTLNGRAVTVSVSPIDRLLDTLRYALGLPGTKEGCGEGECGACTVYLDGLPVNSCLVPTYQVRGRDVRTVESIPPGSLAPLLESGATQCGACTPGVVMTACWLRDHPEVRETFTTREIMAGNLCRCTGYDGIIEGVEATLRPASAPSGPRNVATGGASPIRASATRGREVESVPAPEGRRHHATSQPSSVLAPSTLSEALSFLAANPSLVPIAGATDVLVFWPTNLLAHDKTYLDLSALAELRPIAWTDTHLTLGAMTTYWDAIQDHQAVAEFPLLLAAGRQVGAIQIQARATWAGNIANASPAADGVPVLMAYDATVVLASASGTREVPLCDYYTAYRKTVRRPDELITAIRLPRRPYDVNIFEKVGPRRAQAITKVGVAMTRWNRSPTGSAWRIVANSVAPTVRRCPTIERLIDSAAPIASPTDLLPAIRCDVAPIDDLRSTAAYREQVLARVIYHSLRGIAPSFT